MHAALETTRWNLIGVERRFVIRNTYASPPAHVLLAYREDLGSGGVEFQSMRSCRCIRLNWSVAYE